jgi:hypothetical protein
MDRDLGALLAVHVSDSFARDVRARIQAGSVRVERTLPWSSWHRSKWSWWKWSWSRWSWSSLAAAAAVLTTAVLIHPLLARRATGTPPLPPAPAGLIAAPTAWAHARPEGPRVDAARRRRPIRSLPAADVLVPRERAQSLARFLTLVREGALPTSTIDARNPDTSPPPDLILAPVTLDPIIVPEVEVPLGSAPGGRGPQ